MSSDHIIEELRDELLGCIRLCHSFAERIEGTVPSYRPGNSGVYADMLTCTSKIIEEVSSNKNFLNMPEVNLVLWCEGIIESTPAMENLIMNLHYLHSSRNIHVIEFFEYFSYLINTTLKLKLAVIEQRLNLEFIDFLTVRK